MAPQVKFPKRRDPYALAAKMRKAGRHKDRKKAANKKACRKAVDQND